MAGEAMLQIRQVSKSFGATRVLHDVTLDVPRGAIVSLLGASGSGKTTLLQIIAGLQEPDSGTLLIDGKSMHRVPAFQRPVNMMFQSYALFPHLTVRGNIEYGLKARGVGREERRRLLEWALKLARLESLEGRRPDQLSGGQRQRVALARCLVMKPAILLLDEPMAALDRSLRTQVQHELISIQRTVGTTFILVTHDQEEAMAMSDYIAVMDKGRIVQFGAPRHLYESPCNRFVASFLGSINLFEGCAEIIDAHQCRFVTGEGLEIVIPHPPGCATNAVRALGFRPERLGVSTDRTGALNEWPGTIEQLSFCGNLSHAIIRMPNGRRLEATLMNTQRKAQWMTGSTAFVHLPGEAALVLPE